MAHRISSSSKGNSESSANGNNDTRGLEPREDSSIGPSYNRKLTLENVGLDGNSSGHHLLDFYNTPFPLPDQDFRLEPASRSFAQERPILSNFECMANWNRTQSEPSDFSSGSSWSEDLEEDLDSAGNTRHLEPIGTGRKGNNFDNGKLTSENYNCNKQEVKNNSAHSFQNPGLGLTHKCMEESNEIIHCTENSIFFLPDNVQHQHRQHISMSYHSIDFNNTLPHSIASPNYNNFSIGYNTLQSRGRGNNDPRLSEPREDYSCSRNQDQRQETRSVDPTGFGHTDNRRDGQIPRYGFRKLENYTKILKNNYMDKKGSTLEDGGWDGNITGDQDTFQPNQHHFLDFYNTPFHRPNPHFIQEPAFRSFSQERPLSSHFEYTANQNRMQSETLEVVQSGGKT